MTNCIICNKEFKPRTYNHKLCGNPDCKKEHVRRYQKANKEKISQRLKIYFQEYDKRPYVIERKKRYNELPHVIEKKKLNTLKRMEKSKRIVMDNSPVTQEELELFENMENDEWCLNQMLNNLHIFQK